MNQIPKLNREMLERVHRILGYLNFSSGAEDLSMLRDLNDVFGHLHESCSGMLPHEQIHELLFHQLQLAEKENTTFSDASQARRVLQLVFQHVLPEYLKHHRDLLFHRSSESLFNAFFIGRVFEVVLQLLESCGTPDELADSAIGKLNDFIGHRPVSVLETQKLEPYEHEWVRPIPVYIRQAGVVNGPHRKVIECALELLKQTDPRILDDAQFTFELLDELAVDPRSFDFDHPVNKRPNHHFGQWDEHHIDNQGRYRRFVIHQITLDSLLSRVTDTNDLPHQELIFEAGSVLAGTILMAAGICGYGPGSHDSTVTLAQLLPKIAAYRDQFYADLLSRLPDPHRNRLVEEAKQRQQPFGAARQSLNRQLSRFRAFQMVHVHLALVFSRMGYETAALRHANILPVASARMTCQIECLMYSGTKALEHTDLALASETLPRVFDLLQRAVQCGAVIDPWNIIGFDANYNLFQGTESTVRDHRADDLTLLMEQIFSFASQVWIAAQASDQKEISQRVSDNFRTIVDWWHQFAVHEVSSVESADAHEIFAATEDVASLLNQWQKAGAQRGDVQFWAKHARQFTSPRAYILAINCLIERNDFVTSMALLIHWLTQSDTIPLQQSSGSFQFLVAEWIARQRSLLAESPSTEGYQDTWRRIRKFCDYVEANAGEFWNVPKFIPGSNHDESSSGDTPGESDETDDLDDDDNLYRAAYEDMVFRDSTDDGMEGSIYDSSRHSEESIQAELHRIVTRIEFLQALAEYWVDSAMFVNRQAESCGPGVMDREFIAAQKQKIDAWTRQARKNCEDIQELIRSIQKYSLPQPDGSVDSLFEYDRQRLFKETLLDQAIGLNVDTANSARLLTALSITLQRRHQLEPDTERTLADPEDELWIEVLSSVLDADREKIEQQFAGLVTMIADKPLLYVPLSKGGNSLQIVSTRIRQCMIGQLLESLPRLGMLTCTRELIHVALMMERNQTVRQGAVTEFDELFRVGYTAMVEALIAGFYERDDKTRSSSTASDDEKKELSLFDSLEMLAESMLMLWLSHSQTLRLSVLEKVRDKNDWEEMVDFIDQFGDRIFTQQFLSLSNIRAILHQGVESWLDSIEKEQNDEFGWQIIEQIQNGYSRKDVIRNLTWVLEAIIENFNEYRDYNCTTTQSDNGRLLYVLLDFLRLRSRYDQVCWNLKPVIWAHESLVRLGETKAAGQWRRLLAERVRTEADKLVEQLKRLQDKYSIQMATVSQRVNERFVHPMHVDRLTSLVARAMENPESENSLRAFEMIENYAETLTRQPIGVGFELPGWITALQNEVELLSQALPGSAKDLDSSLVQTNPTGLDDLQNQIRQMPRPG